MWISRVFLGFAMVSPGLLGTAALSECFESFSKKSHVNWEGRPFPPQLDFKKKVATKYYQGFQRGAVWRFLT